VHRANILAARYRELASVVSSLFYWLTLNLVTGFNPDNNFLLVLFFVHMWYKSGGKPSFIAVETQLNKLSDSP